MLVTDYGELRFTLLQCCCLGTLLLKERSNNLGNELGWDG